MDQPSRRSHAPPRVSGGEQEVEAELEVRAAQLEVALERSRWLLLVPVGLMVKTRDLGDQVWLVGIGRECLPYGAGVRRMQRANGKTSALP